MDCEAVIQFLEQPPNNPISEASIRLVYLVMEMKQCRFPISKDPYKRNPNWSRGECEKRLQNRLKSHTIKKAKEWWEDQDKIEDKKDVKFELYRLIETLYGLKYSWALGTMKSHDWYFNPRRKKALAELILALMELAKREKISGQDKNREAVSAASSQLMGFPFLDKEVETYAWKPLNAVKFAVEIGKALKLELCHHLNDGNFSYQKVNLTDDESLSIFRKYISDDMASRVEKAECLYLALPQDPTENHALIFFQSFL
ncbi:uncharacterized protein SETTUDRAFT_165118 [Exserohilum turcica Et28A]|uniref:Uncharacterized protein n=1 Tax=Exserohilum turcicum (strain 28A) TaxID=671987 RepID=R0K2R4_EXST2|nr:uncharacterized protein SETTUDRAFT_165118 [Exserohilum turcica Et28A]EOA82662.1 hypothetical protein SETTUDRAFT_165118 [Exserohilum turcica Et28A]